MRDLEYGPQHLVLLLALVACILGVLELILKLQESVLDVVESLWRWLAAFAPSTDRRHDDGGC